MAGTLNYANEPAGVLVDLAAGTTVHQGSGQTDHFSNVDTVIASHFNDSVVGGPGNHTMDALDGTDMVMLVWLGQRRIPGIESGRTLRVHGRVGKLENGAKAIYNPRYEIQK